jgi:hypothetical protein
MAHALPAIEYITALTTVIFVAIVLVIGRRIKR